MSVTLNVIYLVITGCVRENFQHFMWVLVLYPTILGESMYGIKLLVTGSPSFTVKKLEWSKQAYSVEYISME